MRDYLKRIDQQTNGPRYDVTPLFADAEAFASLVDDLIGQAEGCHFDLVAGIDALGFILGAAIATRTGRGFVTIRKDGKLPVETVSADCVDYTGHRKSLHLRPDALTGGARVLLVDEWIESGAQVRAAATLIESVGGTVAGIATIHVDVNDSTRALLNSYPLFYAELEE